MVPNNWLTVLLFLVLVAPGIAFDLLVARRRVGVKESAFREAGRVVLASLTFSAIGVVIFLIVQLLLPRQTPDLVQLAGKAGSDYAVKHHWKVILALAIIIAGSMLAAVFAEKWLNKKVKKLKVESSWTRVFRTDCPSGCAPHARVRLADGAVYVGRVTDFTADLELAERELVLGPPLYSRKKDGNSLARLDDSWQRVVINGPVVQVLAVRYFPIERAAMKAKKIQPDPD